MESSRVERQHRRFGARPHNVRKMLTHSLAELKDKARQSNSRAKSHRDRIRINQTKNELARDLVPPAYRPGCVHTRTPHTTNRHTRPTIRGLPQRMSPVKTTALATLQRKIKRQTAKREQDIAHRDQFRGRTGTFKLLSKALPGAAARNVSHFLLGMDDRERRLQRQLAESRNAYAAAIRRRALPQWNLIGAAARRTARINRIADTIHRKEKELNALQGACL